jgi:ABC-2 type transport system permease protein
MWERIRVVVRKELMVVLRDGRMRVILFLPPLVQLIIFGVVVNLDIEDNRLAWMDLDQSPESRELMSHFVGSPYFRLVQFPSSEEEIDLLLDSGIVPAVIRILPGFGSDLQAEGDAQIQFLVDGSDSNTAAILSNYTARVIAEFNQEYQLKKLDARGVSTVSIPQTILISRSWFNPDLRSQDYFIPGVVVNIIALITVILTSMAVVREKEIGTMEQLMVTPIRPMELMLGKTIPFAIIGLIEVGLITAAALIVFRIPFRGSPLLLLVSSILFLLTTLGTGLLISTVSNTQQQAMMGSFFFFLPTFMLSGFAFPISSMPEPVQYLTYLNPIRYYLEIVRGIFLKGTGFPVLWPQMAALLVFGCAVVLLSSIRFRKRLD